MKIFFKHQLVTLIAGIIFVFPQAFAIDLQTARSQGVVGEKLDGYVAAVKASPEVESLVTEVNKRRQQEYQRISQENGKSVKLVAKLAADSIVEKLPTGSLYQGTEGGWKKK